MLSPEWKDRVDHWIYKLSEEFYEPKGILNFEGYTTYEMLTEQEAETGPFMTMPEGTKWGRMWNMAGSERIWWRMKAFRVKCSSWIFEQAERRRCL